MITLNTWILCHCSNITIATETLHEKLLNKTCTWHPHHADTCFLSYREYLGQMVYLEVVAEPDLQGLVGQFEVVLVEVDLGHQDVGVGVGVLHLQAVVQCALGRINVTYSRETFSEYKYTQSFYSSTSTCTLFTVSYQIILNSSC